MLLIACPWCGPRAEIEFRHAGAAHLVRPAGPGISDEAWSAYLYNRTNARGVARERWRHVHGCGRFFNAARDTVNDAILATYRPDEPPPEFPTTKEPA